MVLRLQPVIWSCVTMVKAPLFVVICVQQTVFKPRKKEITAAINDRHDL